MLLAQRKVRQKVFCVATVCEILLTAMIDDLFLPYLFIAPAPLSIKFMTRGFVQAEIDKLKGDPQYTTKFTSEFERKKNAPPPPAKSTRSAKQSAPPTSSKKPLIKNRADRLWWTYQRMIQS